MTARLCIVRASPTRENLRAILGLIEEAAAWLRYKDTDQWASPWPDEKMRDDRVRRGLEAGRTRIVWDGDRAAATVTTAPEAHPAIWSEPECSCDLSAPAIYIHRLITARDYSGAGLGAQLIDWAGLRARREYGAKWIRIDVWATNAALHDYFQRQGFGRCGRCPDEDYPAGALFQKPTAEIQPMSSPMFYEAARR